MQYESDSVIVPIVLKECGMTSIMACACELHQYNKARTIASSYQGRIFRRTPCLESTSRKAKGQIWWQPSAILKLRSLRSLAQPKAWCTMRVWKGGSQRWHHGVHITGPLWHFLCITLSEFWKWKNDTFILFNKCFGTASWISFKVTVGGVKGFFSLGTKWDNMAGPWMRSHTFLHTLDHWGYQRTWWFLDEG